MIAGEIKEKWPSSGIDSLIAICVMPGPYGGSSGEIILDSLSFSQAPPVNFGNANEAENIWDAELGLVIAGEKTVEEAVTAICEQIAPVLAESN